MNVVILAGGLGTRMEDETKTIPKPMVTIGGMPLLEHLVRFYTRQGFGPVTICAGYKGEVIHDYFRDDARVKVLDTGEDSPTGDRILQALCSFRRSYTFMLTYGDGLSNVNLHALRDFHDEQGRYATVTAVHPPGRFGVLRLSGNRVAEFEEKPQTDEGWVSGGYFILEPQAVEYIQPGQMFEHDPLECLARNRDLAGYKHEGFWQPMDTPRDKRLLEQLWADGAPWIG